MRRIVTLAALLALVGCRNCACATAPLVIRDGCTVNHLSNATDGCRITADQLVAPYRDVYDQLALPQSADARVTVTATVKRGTLQVSFDDVAGQPHRFTVTPAHPVRFEGRPRVQGQGDRRHFALEYAPQGGAVDGLQLELGYDFKAE